MSGHGIVYLVGAGPGDPGLITQKALDLIKTADVILFDNLANRELLDHAKPSAEMMFVGKQGGRHYVKQDDTTRFLIDKAKAGNNVVRLKGGDPLVFGRGSEEALALKEEGILFEIVPGITSGIAAPAYAGIPFTHRNLVTQSVFVTAHETPGKPETQVDWGRLAGMKNTNLVIYMGVSRIGSVADKLISGGMDPGMPAAIIRNGTLPYQESWLCSLSTISTTVDKFNIKPPVIFFIGPTAALMDELKWAPGRPLAGKKIVVTRARDQAQSFYRKLSNLGARAVPFPVIKTEKSRPGESISGKLSGNNYDWLVFSSENGVRYFFELMEEEKTDARSLAGLKIAVIGSGTSTELSKYNLLADFIPTEFTSEVLVKEMNQKGLTDGKRFLRVKGDFRKDQLHERLVKNGAKVDDIEVYKILPDKPMDHILEDIKENGADAFLFTSMSTVNNFFLALSDDIASGLLNNSTVISIGPVTATALRDRDIRGFHVSDIHTIDGMTDVLLKVLSK